jgi:hypothetical protein
MASGIRELGKLAASGFAHWEEEIALFREACIFDALSLALDHQFAAIASHTETWGLGYEKYFEFLQRRNPEVG